MFCKSLRLCLSSVRSSLRLKMCSRLRFSIQVITFIVFNYWLSFGLQIVELLEADSKLRNIADLCHTLISQTHIQPTLQLYMQIAFLVRHSSLALVRSLLMTPSPMYCSTGIMSYSTGRQTCLPPNQLTQLGSGMRLIRLCRVEDRLRKWKWSWQSKLL